MTEAAASRAPEAAPGHVRSGDGLLGAVDVRALADQARAPADEDPRAELRHRREHGAPDRARRRRRRRTTSCSRSAPGWARSPSACSRRSQRVVAVEIDPVLGRGAAADRRGPAPRPGRPPHGGDRGRAAARRAARDRRPPRWWRTCRTTWRCRCCCTCSRRFPSIDRVLVMVQAEVADRLAAGPGSRTYGVPSREGRAGTATSGGPARSARTVFWPAPNVDSRSRRVDPDGAAGDHGDARGGVRGGRRGVRAAPQDACARRWPAGPGRPPAAEAALRAAGVDPAARGEQLGVADFARIAEHRPARTTSATAP